MDESKERACYSNCAICSRRFEESLPPLIFCRNAHLCCAECLSLKADGYEYASFMCPLCLELACKATAVRCAWLPQLLRRLQAKQGVAAAERTQLLRQIQTLKQQLKKSQSNESNLKRKLEELEKRKHKFSQNWRKALDNVVSKKVTDGNWSSHQLQGFEKYPSKLISQMDRLCEENRRMQASIEKLRK